MKRFLSLLLALAMMFTLVACGGGNGANSDGSDAGVPDTIKIGVMGTMTGEQALDGDNIKGAIALIQQELDADGGLKVGDKTVKIEFVFGDSEAKPEQAVNVIQKFINQDQVVAVLGPNNSSDCLSAYEVAQTAGVPCISNCATNVKVTQIGEYCFRSCFIDPFQGSKMASFASEKLSAKTAAVLYNTGSDYSIGCAEAFQEQAAAMGMEVVAVESYADGATEFQSQLTNIAAKTPDVLFIPDYYSVIALVAQQANAAGVTATMLGSDGWDSVLDVVTDASLLEGSYYCSGYSTQDTSEAVQTFVSAYQEKYDASPNMFAAQGYDAAMIMCAALAKAEEQGLTAGTAEYMAAVIDALNATDMECVTGHVTYDEFNNPEKTAAIINITGGAAEFWGKY